MTEAGKKEAEAVGEVLAGVACIYSGEFLRYLQTNEQVNRHLRAPVVIDERLNEVAWRGKETSREYEARIHEFLNDVIARHGNEERVICMTSGVALHWFMTFFMKGEPIGGFVRMGAGVSVSPVTFYYDKERRERYIAEWQGAQ